MKKFLYIYNPYSGMQVGGSELDGILAAFYKRNIYVIPHRLYSMENDTVLEDYLRAENAFDGIAIAGGDGTVGKIIDRMIKNGNKTPVGIVPGGTCNDFARNLGMPASVFDCISVFAEGNTADIDMLRVGSADGVQYVCNSIAAGVFVGVSYSTSPEFKKVFGSLAYYITAVGELANMKSFNIRVETPDGVTEEKALVFAVLNGTDVGGMKQLITDADLSDGMMNVMIVKDCSPAERAAVGIDLLAHRQNKNIIHLECPKCSISVDQDMQVSLDGEAGLGLPYEIDNVPGLLRTFVPGSFPRND